MRVVGGLSIPSRGSSRYVDLGGAVWQGWDCWET